MSSSLSFCILVYYLIILININSSQPTSNNNELIRTRIHSIRRERLVSSSSGSDVVTQNVTFILTGVESGCGQYCADQSQHNDVCINKGCAEWKSALRDGCFTTCTGIESSYRENYACQIGCSRTVEDYYRRISPLLSPFLEPPTLVSNSLKSSSLRLTWDTLPFVDNLPYISYSVQRRTNNPQGLWETLPSTNETNISVINLRPFTHYQFRVGWILALDLDPLYSRESNPILTLEKGLPSPPQVTSIQPISNTSVAITWNPPLQPNGRLVAYILKLQPLVPNGHSVIKEIPTSQNPRGYTFSGLFPLTNYSLQVSAQNREGEGEAARVSFITPQGPLGNPDGEDGSKGGHGVEPFLLIQGSKSVYLQPLDLLMDPQNPPIFQGLNVTAIGVHVKLGYFFVSTSDGDIKRISLRNNSNGIREEVLIISRERLELGVAHISVDWLHNKVYIVGKQRRATNWVIKKCDLNGNSLTTIYTKLMSRPLYFAADPFTGYLYWVSGPSQFRGGLYKLNLTGDHEWNQARVIVEDNELGPFTLDVANYRILVIHKGRNTVLSVSLDGDVTDIRSNTQAPQWTEAISLTMFNGILFWNTQTSLVTEEYNSAANVYYQNRFDVARTIQPIGRLLMFHPDAQPIPIPLSAPVDFQVLYSQTKARITWRPPPPISALGVGAWCEWSYHLRVSDNRSFYNISDTEYSLEGLRPSTFYTLQIQAYSSSGKGPMTPPNRGKTLRETNYNITLIWGSFNGLYATDTLGEDLKLLTSTPAGGIVGKGMTSIAWHENGVFFAMSNGSVFHYTNLDEGPVIIRGISYAQSIAFDYIGQRLYWSNPKKQTIYRCVLDTGNCVGREALQIVTMAREIAVDSYKGLLAWATGHSIEMSRMNGYAHGTLFQNGLFSGKQIMGMTLDTEQSRIYWITRSATGSTLQRLQYNIRGAQLPIVIANYEDTLITGPIRYFNDRLLWIQNSSEAVITDTYGQGKSSLRLSTVSNITNVYVKDQGALRWPGGVQKSRIQVNPEPVMEESVVVKGTWNNFSVHWDPVQNTNYGKVLYEVMINNGLISRITEHSNITLPNPGLGPYSEIAVSITALTYWSNAKPTVVKLRTPDGNPSEPQNLRIYIQQNSSSSLSITRGNGSPVRELRWDPPTEPNGIIIGYILQCWKGSNVRISCHCEEYDSLLSSCRLSQPRTLEPKTQYYISIAAYTKSGPGPYSKKVLVDTGYESPVPLVLITAPGQLQIMDIDRNELKPLNLGYVSPITASFSALDQEIFWFNEGQDLMRAKIMGPGYNKSRILSLAGKKWEASHLKVDWIGRRLYWVVEGIGGSSGEYGIMMYDLARLDHNDDFNEGDPVISDHVKIKVTSNKPIKSLAVNPFRNALYWTAVKNFGSLGLYTAESRDNFTVRPFLSRHDPEHSSESPSCNCSHIPVTGTASFDPTGYKSLAARTVLFISYESIWATDEDGCSCIEVVNTTTQPHILGGLHSHIYFGTGSTLSATMKGSSGSNNGNGGVTELLPSGVRELAPYGPSAQPFPTNPMECLIPTKLEPEKPQLTNLSSHSLHLQLPQPQMNCTEYPGISQPSPMYSVYYGTVDETLISRCTPTSPSYCKVIQTLSPSLHITDLHPYTTYTVFVSLTTYYLQREGGAPLLCAPIMLRTAPGAPMPPELPKVTPLTPTSVRVEWKRPLKLNGEKVWYDVHWGRSSIGKWIEKETTRQLSFATDLIDLTPNTNYSIWVRAFSASGHAFSDSPSASVVTYPLPIPLSELNPPTPHTLSLEWSPPLDNTIIMHQFIYREATSSTDLGMRWTELEMENFTIPGKQYKLIMEKLKPKTYYEFKLRAWYAGDPAEPFLYPTNGSMVFETKADRPSQPPYPPIAKGIGKQLFEVSWEKADENGAVIESYSLEARLTYQAPHETEIETNNDSTMVHGKRAPREVQRWQLKQWVEVYNGRETRWVVDDGVLDARNSYSFRVRAWNMYGWGPYSNESVSYSLEKLTILAEPQSVGVIVAAVFLSFVVLGAFAVLLVLVYRRKQNEKPTLSSTMISSDRQVELATLRELPGGTSFIHSNNMLYTQGISDLLIDLDLAGVPKVGWHQITVIGELGSGAFGIVYEGIVLNLGGGNSQARVALKSLRKSANSTEKQEFIQEAKLMAQFKHPNIIQLMGICVDTDPCYLLLELMGDGDLLNYLRNHRPDKRPSNPLGLSDLLVICVDAAKGCAYLEELHFVHRDIAARNCLVSFVQDDETGGKKRVVKIGDFGLARDIYRNDYYRKDGEALLPVRWMAPESLVDGIFTTQSDVWAFGVLLWEIMTLGQQPYQARTNVEVLNYVRAGGTLHRPPHCPHILGDLMSRCWEFLPDNRPSFKYCLNQLDSISRHFYGSNSPPPSFPPLHDMNYDPYSYSEGGSTVKYTIHLRQDSDSVFHEDYPQSRPPNYLEVLSEGSGSGRSVSLTDEGYEVPLPKRPPRLSSSNPSTCEIGLPSPPLSYRNAETLPLRHHPQYRNLLASSTSEDADFEDQNEGSLEDSYSCGIQNHHYFSNVEGRHHHLRGIPCHYAPPTATTGPTTATTTLFNNRMYQVNNPSPSSVKGHDSGNVSSESVFQYQNHHQHYHNHRGRHVVNAITNSG